MHTARESDRDADTDAWPVVAQPGGGQARYRRRRRIRKAVGTGAVVVVLGAVAVAGYGFGGDRGGQPAASTNLPPATAAATRTTLTQTERLFGTLGYGATATVIARASAAAGAGNNAAAGTNGGVSGAAQTTSASPSPSPSPSPTMPTTNTVTWLPPVGSVVKPGQPVYRVDNRPVILLAGATPPYRMLSAGLTGPDVKQFELNLKAFGYSGFTADSTYTSATATAVSRWQKDLDWPQTGTVDVNQIVVAPGGMRITEHNVQSGADATGEVLAYTANTRIVTVALEVTRQHLIRKGLSATIELPDGKEVTGKVASIGTVASTSAGGPDGGDQQGGGQQPQTPTVDVVFTVADQATLGALDGAPVQLVLVTSERENVLTVPVGALVALAEGGYGVQVVNGDTTRYVAVETGMFADGQVEITGGDLTEGMTVGVPA
jgi:Putative peptidoglycan binding domain